ncbi:MAG: hypothetical protein EDX89_00500 [Acidobacteria bacterium]|nr:MAG: hypothetical protein EDX89_00500 [Acidobacteriota bacterium]
MAASRSVLPLVAALLASTAGLAADRTLYLPGAAETPGAAGSRFSTTLTVSNAGTAPAEALLGLIPSPGRPTPPPVRRVLAPGASLTVPSALATLFGTAYDAGTITVSGTHDLVATLITSNVADPEATYGIGVSAVPAERLLAGGDVAHAIWVSDSGDLTKGFRTNVAITFVEDGTEVELQVVDGNGTARDARTLTAPRPVAWQATMASLVGGGAVELGRVRFRVVRGRALCGVVVNDNVTSDALVVVAQRSLDAAADLLLSGAARGEATGGLDWGTDVRLYNPGESPAPVTLSPVVAAGSGQPVTITVPPDRVVEVLDVLASTGLPPGSAAAVRIQSAVPVLAAGRTARIDRTGQVPGSYAAQLLPVPYPDGLLAQGGAGYLTGLSHTSAGPGVRTTLSLFAGPAGAEGTLALRDESGALTAQTGFTLGPSESRRASLDDWFLGGVTPPHRNAGASPDTVAPGSRVDVQVGAGAVDTLAVQVDSGSGDPFAQRPIPGCDTTPVGIEDLRVAPAEPTAGESATLSWAAPSDLDSQSLVETENGNVPLSRTQRSVSLVFTQPGDHTATLTVFRGCQRDSRSVTFRVACATSPSVATSSLPQGYPNVPYGPVTLSQAGGDPPVTWKATGLPAGLVLSPDGVLSGTPAASGEFQPTFTVTDVNGCSGSRTLPLTVACPAITVGPGSLPTGLPGESYGPVTLTQSGGTLPVSWAVEGTLPAGMTFTAGGVLSGIPTEVGTFPLVFRVTDANGCTGSAALSLRVLCPPLTIEPDHLPAANPGVPYGPISFVLVGGRAPVVWSATGLPAGLSLSPSGVLSGTTTASGLYSVTVRARDARGCTEQAVYQLSTEGAPYVVSTVPANGATSQPANVSLTVTFSEPVALTGSWFQVSCATGSTPYVIGPATAVVTGGPTTWTIDPVQDIPPGVGPCTVTIYAAGVTDEDTYDPPDQMAADHVFSFSLDPGPYVVSTAPADGATAPASTNVAVTFNEPVAVSGTWLSVSCSMSGTFDPSNSVVTGGPTTFVLDPPADLSAGDVCFATVFAAQVTDLDPADPPDQMAANHVFDFTVDSAPSVVATAPPNGAVQQPSSVSAVVTFTEPVALTGDWFLWTCGSGGTLVTITPATSVVTGGPATYTIDPVADVPPLSSPCTVTIFAAQVADVDPVDPPDQMAADHVFSFALDAPPVVQTTVPAPGATGVPGTTNVSITFSEPVAVSGDWLVVACSTSGTFSPSNSAVTGGPTTFVLDPSTEIAAGDTCVATVVGTLVTDLDAADPPDQMPGNQPFAFTIDAPPAVASTVPADGATSQPADVSLTVTFDEPVALNGSWFLVSCDTGSTPYVINPSTAVVTGGPTDWTIDPISDVPPGASPCTVTIYAAGVTDLDASDPPDQMAADHVFTFSLDPGPYVVSTDPAAGALAAASTNVTVTFNEPVALGPTWLQVSCSDSGVFDPSNSVVTGGPTTWVLDPPADLSPGDACVATVFAAQVTDLDPADPPDQMAADHTFAFSVDSPPVVVATSPPSGAVQVPSNVSLTVTFDEPVTPTGDWFLWACGAGPTLHTITPATSVVTGGPTTWTVDPVADIPPLSSPCVVTVFGAQVTDVDTVDPPDAMEGDYTVFFDLDAPPVVVSTNPVDGAANVPASQSVTVVFSEPVSPAGNWIRVVCPTSGIHDTTSGVVIGSGTIFTLDPTVDFAGGEVCQATVFAALVTDLDTADPPDGMPADHVFTFTVDAAPAVVSTFPPDGATSVPRNVTLTVGFSEPVNLLSAWFSASCDTGSTPYVFGPATSVVTGGPTAWTIDPNSDIPPGVGPCTVTVFAAAVTDLDPADPPDQMAADHVFTFGLDDAPFVTATDPVDSAVAPVSTNVLVTFSEPVAVAGAWLQVFCSTSGTFDPFNSVVSGGPTTFALDPPVDLSPGDICFATVTASLVTDLDTADPPDAMAADVSWGFTTDTAPFVSSTLPANGATGVPTDTTVSVTFSETVDATTATFSVECPSGSPQAYALSASPAPTFVLTPLSPLPAGEVCTVTVFAAQVADDDPADPPDGLGADYVFSFQLPPALVADTYPEPVVGNVGVDSARIPWSVLDNDSAPPTSTISAYDAVSMMGGQVTMVTSGPGAGQFRYEPPTGFVGGDSFQYTVSSPGGTATSSASLSVGPPVWFVSLAGCAGPCDGRLSSPFPSVASFLAVNDGAPGHPGPGQGVFLYENGAPYTGPVSLLAGQALVGQDSVLPLAAILGLPLGVSSDPLPAMNPGPPATLIQSLTSGVQLGFDNLLRGFTVGDTQTGDVVGNGFGTLSAAEVSLVGVGPALNLTGGTLNASFDVVDVASSPGGGVFLSGTVGTLSVASGSLTGLAATAFQVVGGAPDVTFGAAMSHVLAASPSPVVDVAATTGGSVTFTAPVFGDMTTDGVRVTGAAGNVTFTTLGLGSGPGSSAAMGTTAVAIDGVTGDVQLGDVTIFTASAVGISVANTTGQVGSTGGHVESEFSPSIQVQGVPAGTPLAMTLGSVANFGSDVGLSLTDTTGTFVIAGDGSTPGSGGLLSNNARYGVRLENAAGVTLGFLDVSDSASFGGSQCFPGTFVDCAAAVGLFNAHGVTLQGVRIARSAQMGVFGLGVTGLSVTGSSITDVGAALSLGSGVFLSEPAGTHLIQDTAISSTFEFGVYVERTLGDTPVTLRRVSFAATGQPEGGPAAVGVWADGSGTVTMLVDDCDFASGEGGGVDVLAGVPVAPPAGRQTAVRGRAAARSRAPGRPYLRPLVAAAAPLAPPEVNLTVQASRFQDSFGAGVRAEAGGTGTLRATVDGNQFTNLPDLALGVYQSSVSPVDAIVTGNAVDNSAAPFVYGGGFDFGQSANGALRALVTGNTVQRTGFDGISLFAFDYPVDGLSDGMHVTVQNNAVAGVETGNGFFASTESTDNLICLDASANSFSTTAPSSFGILVQQGFQGLTGTFQLSGMTPGPVTSVAVETYLDATNLLVAPPTAAVGIAFTGVAPGTCALPGPTPLPPSTP